MTRPKDLEKAIDRTQARIDRMVQDVGLDLARRVIGLTPVRTGRARANWQAGIDGAPTAEVPGTDPRGTATLAAIDRVVRKAHPTEGDTLHITNTAAYAARLESGTAASPPRAMVATAKREFGAMVERAKRKSGLD